MAEAKIYCGSGKTIKTQYGEFLKLSIGPKDFETLLANKNEKGWINLNVTPRKEVGKYGETHSVSVDNWKPTPRDGMVQADAPDGGPATW